VTGCLAALEIATSGPVVGEIVDAANCAVDAAVGINPMDEAKEICEKGGSVISKGLPSDSIPVGSRQFASWNLFSYKYSASTGLLQTDPQFHKTPRVRLGPSEFNLLANQASDPQGCPTGFEPITTKEVCFAATGDHEEYSGHLLSYEFQDPDAGQCFGSSSKRSYDYIADKAECKEAAHFKGLKYTESMVDDNKLPKGCYCTGGQCYFNSHSTGCGWMEAASDQYGSMVYGQRQYLEAPGCSGKFKYEKGTEGSDQCPSGFKPVVSKEQCKLAADYLNVHTHDPITHQPYDQVPRGCVALETHAGTSAVFNTEFAGIRQCFLNDDPTDCLNDEDGTMAANYGCSWYDNDPQKVELIDGTMVNSKCRRNLFSAETSKASDQCCACGGGKEIPCAKRMASIQSYTPLCVREKQIRPLCKFNKQYSVINLNGCFCTEMSIDGYPEKQCYFGTKVDPHGRTDGATYARQLCRAVLVEPDDTDRFAGNDSIQCPLGSEFILDSNECTAHIEKINETGGTLQMGGGSMFDFIQNSADLPKGCSCSITKTAEARALDPLQYCVFNEHPTGGPPKAMGGGGVITIEPLCRPTADIVSPALGDDGTHDSLEIGGIDLH